VVDQSVENSGGNGGISEEIPSNVFEHAQNRNLRNDPNALEQFLQAFVPSYIRVAGNVNYGKTLFGVGALLHDLSFGVS